ncbi:hypothetical protein Ndes2526B_g06806 [Nannochloris sp. 'desiccata']
MCIFQAQRSTAHARHAAAAAEPQKNGVTVQDVEKVQMLIETCIQRVYTLEETCHILESYGVDHRFVIIVWQRLEQENQEFFASYNKALRAR